MTRDYSCKSDGVSIHSTALLNQEIAVEVASTIARILHSQWIRVYMSKRKETPASTFRTEVQLGLYDFSLSDQYIA